MALRVILVTRIVLSDIIATNVRWQCLHSHRVRPSILDLALRVNHHMHPVLRQIVKRAGMAVIQLRVALLFLARSIGKGNGQRDQI